MSEKVINKYGVEVFKTKYGYYACDKETMLKLKALFKEWYRSLSQIAKWKRWNRKAPQNRVIKKKIRDSQGRVCGREVIGPMPEPLFSSIFCEKQMKEGEVYFWDTCSQRYQSKTIQYEEVVEKNKFLVQAFWDVSCIKKNPDEVTKMKVSLEEIDKFYNLLK